MTRPSAADRLAGHDHGGAGLAGDDPAPADRPWSVLAGAPPTPQADRSRPAPTPEDLVAVAAQLGRQPRGVVGIAARCVCGAPLVTRTSPRLGNGEPFPTTYYLTHPAASKAIGRLESQGIMASMNRLLAEDEALAAAHRSAHQDYLDRRAELGEPDELAGVSAGGMPDRVKCLHALAAHALAVGPGVNPVGDWTLRAVAADWRPDRCACRTEPAGGGSDG